ncbi:superoxide dismutase [Candidatus Woesearchaeota archaeon]|nr:superoxide dismutase [Candidatus Woesearchaeota archaeon]
MEAVYMHTLPKLPYAYNALEPYIDEQTMTIHHTKHHQAYIDKLNGAVKSTKFEDMDINEVLKKLNDVPENIRTAVRNHGGGHSNHSFFWQIMAPNAGGEPQGKVADAIKSAFGGFEKFKEEFTNAGLNRFGSGWAWLVLNNGKLEVYSTANQDSPLMEGKTPILGVDVWEHAYYKKWGPARVEYIKTWWNVVNWPQVEEYYKKAMKK